MLGRDESGRAIIRKTNVNTVAPRFRYRKIRWTHRRDDRRRGVAPLPGIINRENVDALTLRAQGRCEICGRPDGPTVAMDWDHDHQTSRVRGLLCHSCNVQLGRLEAGQLRVQDVAWVRAARWYLVMANDPVHDPVLGVAGEMRAVTH